MRPAVPDRSEAVTDRDRPAPDFQALFESAPGLYLVLSPDLVIIGASDAYLRATLTDRAAIMGRPLFEVFPDNPDDPGATGERNLGASLDRVRTTLRSDRMDIQKYDIRRPASEGGGFEVRYWSPQNHPVLATDGSLAAIIHQVEDVTQVVQLETQAEVERLELERISTEMARFFALSSDLFGVFGLDGAFRRANPAWESAMGHRPADLVGRAFMDLVHPDDIERTVAEFERATAEGTSTTHFQNRYRHADGSYRWLEWTGRLVPGEAVHYSAARDITGRKHAEEALESARREAERASHAKSEFLSRMSHELRTPLNAILGFAQLLDADDLDADQRESVMHITRAGRHLLELINEILDISRIEAGQLSISPEPVAVGELLAEVAGIIGPLADRNRVRVIGADAADGLHVLADRQRLRQVLVNLLGNAVKYNVEGGKVRLSTATVDGDRLRISVADTGRGVAPERLGSMFRPFERLGAERSTVEGTGIGLALSKGLVEAMGGIIGVASVLGQGTTLWVEFPIVEAPVAAYERENGHGLADVQPMRRRTLLVVEDNAANLRLIERVLARRPGIELRSAGDGATGLELARTLGPDLVLLDLHLPDMGGEEVFRALHEDQGERRMPVVIVSADATRAQVSRMIEAGAAGYLTKPIDVSALLALIDRLLADTDGGPA